MAHHASAAGKGDCPRAVDIKAFRNNHDFIYGKTASYTRHPSGEDCCMRGVSDKEKCHGPVFRMSPSTAHGPYFFACAGHRETEASRTQGEPFRAYVPEQ